MSKIKQGLIQRAEYLVQKNQGDIAFAIKQVSYSAQCHFNDTQRFANDIELLEILEDIHNNNKSKKEKI